MAYNDTEVEVKVHLSKKKFEEVKRKLKKVSKFVKTSTHIDDYYSPEYRSFLKAKYPYEWLTIRQRDGVVKINYKHWYPEGVKDTTHCDEYETDLKDIKQIEKILKALNISKILTVNKKREVYVYKGRIEIALDIVKSLGYFIEAEALKDLGSVEKTRESLVEFLRSIGITSFKMIPGGYGGAILRKKGLAK